MDVSGLIGDIVTAPATFESHNELAGTENRLITLLQGLVGKTLHDRISSYKFKNLLISKFNGLRRHPNLGRGCRRHFG